MKNVTSKGYYWSRMFYNFSFDSKYIHFSLKISFRFVFENLKVISSHLLP